MLKLLEASSRGYFYFAMAKTNNIYVAYVFSYFKRTIISTVIGLYEVYMLESLSNHLLS